MAKDACVRGLPGGQRRECFSRYFLHSNGSFMSCMSFMMGVLPLCLVFGLCVVIVLYVLLVSLVLCLSLLGGIELWVCGGLWAFWGSGLCRGPLAQLDLLLWWAGGMGMLLVMMVADQGAVP